MAGPHRAHIDGLYTAYPAVVLQLHTGKVTQRVGYGVRVQAFQFGTFQRMTGNDFTKGEIRQYDDLIDMLYAVEGTRLNLLREGYGSRKAQ